MNETQPDEPRRYVVLGGGVSVERTVSLRSAAAVADTLREWVGPTVVNETLNGPCLPGYLDPAEDLIVPMLHGTFGEDGFLQFLLEHDGFVYAGCDAASSRLCIDKVRTKAEVALRGLEVLPQLTFFAHNPPAVAEVTAMLGAEVVFKPTASGSSVGLCLVDGEDEIRQALATLPAGQWMAEPRVRGMEVSVGILHGKALTPVGIEPRGGVYDYVHKYTSGQTAYHVPARLPQETLDRLASYTEEASLACGCRDFARVDFIVPEVGEPVFLEVNTLPGMTPTSLLPKSASGAGFDFANLVLHMIAPALERFRRRREPTPTCHE